MLYRTIGYCVDILLWEDSFGRFRSDQISPLPIDNSSFGWSFEKAPTQMHYCGRHLSEKEAQLMNNWRFLLISFTCTISCVRFDIFRCFTIQRRLWNDVRFVSHWVDPDNWRDIFIQPNMMFLRQKNAPFSQNPFEERLYLRRPVL